MDYQTHVNYLVSLVDDKGEMRITDPLRAKISVTVVSQSKEATELLKNLINKKLQEVLQ